MRRKQRQKYSDDNHNYHKGGKINKKKSHKKYYDKIQVFERNDEPYVENIKRYMSDPRKDYQKFKKEKIKAFNNLFESHSKSYIDNNGVEFISARNKIKIRLAPIYCIVEDLGNGYCLKYYRFSGHTGFYHNDKLIYFVDNKEFEPLHCEHIPYFYDIDTKKLSLSKHLYKNQYEQIKTYIHLNKLGSNRSRFKIIRNSNN